MIDRGLAPAAMAAKMTEAELFEFLFLPGFSTKSEVTSLSGRGVGLDVVQSMVQSVGGSVRLSSQLGAGTCFTLQLPITMSVIRALIVRIAGQPYAFPLSRLESIQRVEATAVETLEGRPFFTLDGETVGLVPATQVLDLPQMPTSTQLLPVVVLSDRGSRFGVVVDEFLGERDLDVRPTDPRLGKIPNISTASVLEDGWPVLIIDVEDLVRSIDNLLHGRRFKLAEATASDVDGEADEESSGRGRFDHCPRTRTAVVGKSGLCGRCRRRRDGWLERRPSVCSMIWLSATWTCHGWMGSNL